MQNYKDWQKSYLKLKEYYIQYGHTVLIRCYNKELYDWLMFQINNKEVITKTRMKMLNEVDRKWYLNEYKRLGTSFSEQAIYHYIKQVFPDAKNSCRDFGFELDVYIPSLNIGIEYDGQVWHQNKQKDLDKNKKCEKENINLIRIRESKCPKLYSSSIDYYINGKSRGTLKNTIEYLTCNKVEVNLVKDKDVIKKRILEFYNHLFDIKYQLAKEYYEKNRHLLVSSRDKDLCNWILVQKIKKAKNMLEKDKIKKLSEIGMIWENKNNAKWNIKYQLVRQYLEKNGDINIPNELVINDIKNLKSWIVTQKSYYRKGKLNNKKINLLKNIGII